MCGIVGYVGGRPCRDLLIAGLEKLEYRGYDSAGLSLLEDVEPFERLPQKLQNVRIKDRSAVEGAKALWDAVDEENSKLEGRGRVLVRPSGTEPLLRIMVEAPDEAERDEVLDRLIEIARRELG